MSGIDWTFIGVVVSVIGIIVVIIIGYWQIHKSDNKSQSNSQMIQNDKQVDKIHPQKEKKFVKKRKKFETFYEDTIIIEAGWHEKLIFELYKGDKIKGIAYETEKDDFSCFIMKEANYPDFLQHEIGTSFKSYMDEISIEINIEIPDHDMWYFVFDAFGKQNDREIKIILRKIKT